MVDAAPSYYCSYQNINALDRVVTATDESLAKKIPFVLPQNRPEYGSRLARAASRRLENQQREDTSHAPVRIPRNGNLHGHLGESRHRYTGEHWCLFFASLSFISRLIFHDFDHATHFFLISK